MKSALEYATIPLPQKPKLAPWITIVDLGDNRIQLRGAEYVFTLNHPLFIEVFESVRPLLDGNHSLEEITTSGGDVYLPTSISFLLKMLRANSLLQEGNVAPPSPLTANDLEKHESLIQYLSHYVSDPVGALALLKETKLGIIGSSSLSKAIQNSLVEIGIDPVFEIDSFPASSSKNGNHFPDEIKALDYLIACQETPGAHFFQRINSICLENSIRWMKVTLKGTTGIFGPTVIPHQSACYTCYEGRLASNAEDLESHLAYSNQLENSETIVNEGLLLPLITSIASQVALELLRLVTSMAPPKTIGRFYELDPVSPTYLAHDVLRLPRCPACVLGNPPKEAWDNTVFLSHKAS